MLLKNYEKVNIMKTENAAGPSVPANGLRPGLFNLYIRCTDGQFKKLTSYAMTHAECCVIKSKFSAWSQARILLVKETK